MGKRKINFFWKGKNFTYLHRLCVKTHLYVGHKIIIWLSGEEPKNEYWIKDLNVKVENADDIFNINNFLNNGANLKTASDLWRFNFLYKHGGIYCDLDALAINEFPKDDWILCSSLPQHPKEKLSIGVIGAPKKQEIFLNCIENIKKEWGNVTVFGNEYEKMYGNIKYTHANELFYPYSWREWNTLFKKIEIPNVYSIHLYHTMLERNNMIKSKEEYLKMKNTLIYKLIKKFDGDI